MVGKASLALPRPGWRQQWLSTGAWMRMRERDLVPRAGERAAWEWECCPVLVAGTLKSQEQEVEGQSGRGK